MSSPDPERDDDLERLQKELEEQGEKIFTHPPRPEPMPDVLKKAAPEPEPPAEGPSEMIGMAKAWAFALDFIFTILAAAGLGWLFDRWRSTGPAGLLVGLALGFVFAFWRIIRATQNQERAEAERRRRRGGS
jgi:F0F1-type ATP synthase assembly protein I